VTATSIIDELKAQPTTDVETAARALGVGRQTAYAAARAGTLPVIRVGRKFRVLTKPLLRMVGEAD
jgi:excisionase family DNA binding protein